MKLPHDLQPVADVQLGLVTRTQLYRSGVTRDALRWSLGRTARLALPGVVALFTGQLSPAQRLVAAALLAGPDGQIASLTAARWHGVVDVPDDGVVRLLVPWSHAARRVGFVAIRRTRRPDSHPWHRGPLTICCPARSLVDAAREMRISRDVDATIISAIQRRRVRLDDVAHEVEAGAVRGSAAVRRALALARTGAWSVPEVDLLTVLSTSRVLPRAWPNPELRAPDGSPLPTPDAYFDDVALAIQVHSRTYHQRDKDWQATVEGDTALGEVGVHVIGVVPESLDERPAAFLQSVERTYLALLRAGRRPDVTITPRGPGLVA